MPFLGSAQTATVENPNVPTPYSTPTGGAIMTVFERVGDDLIEIPSQFNAEERNLSFILWPTEGRAERILELKDQILLTESEKLELYKDTDNVTILKEDKPILTYVNGIVEAPEGVSPLFRKSGFIHPLYAPNGTRLTRIQPSDHYHHYGIWGPWTKTTINGQHVDFWNLKDSLGTVLFHDFKSYQSGKVFAGFVAEQHHLNFKATPANSLALVEELGVKTWNIGDRYLIDYTTSFHTDIEDGILFDQYRYGGGLGFRATEKWGSDNSTVLTSEGKTRLDADGTKARWVIIQGESDVPGQKCGILFMSHPSNRAHPEPMRMWPEDNYERKGNVFFEFCPIRLEEWKIEKGNNYQLQYRMLVFDGELNLTEAEAYWQAFAKTTNITFN